MLIEAACMEEVMKLVEYVEDFLIPTVMTDQ